MIWLIIMVSIAGAQVAQSAAGGAPGAPIDMGAINGLTWPGAIVLAAWLSRRPPPSPCP